jgi:hypothetical protein
MEKWRTEFDLLRAGGIRPSFSLRNEITVDM